MTTLVFLEHHEGELPEALARRALEGGLARRRRSPARSSAPASSSWPRRRARTARGRSTSPTTPGSRRRCRSRASTCSRSSSRDEGFDTVLFGAVGARRRRRRRPRGAARRGPELGPRPTSRCSDGRLVGKRPALPGLGLRRRRLDVRAAHRALPHRRVRRGRDRRHGAGREARRRAPGLLDARAMVEQAHEETSGPSIEDADVIVAGGRGPRRPGELRARRGAREGARRRRRRDARGRRRGLVPVRDAGRPDGQDRLAEALRRRAASRARSSTRSACRASGDDRRDQQGPERADLRVLATSASSATCTRSSRS